MFLLAKYNTQTTIYFNVVKRGVVDLAATGDWTPATGDTKVSKDGGSFANSTNNPAAVAGTGSVGWSLVLTATELSAAVVHIQIVDSATKAVEDQALIVYTYGNASAKIPVDLSDTVRAGLTALPNAPAESAGGMFTRGSGAGQINQQANGQVDANVARWLNTAAATPNTAGKPLVDVDLWKGVAPNALISGRVDSYIGAVAAAVVAAGSFAAGALDAVWSTAARTLTAFGFSVTVGTNNDKTGYSILATDKDTLVDLVWDESIESTHQTSGTAGKKLDDAGAGATPPTAAAIADAVWDEALSGHLSAGSTGLKLNSAGGAGGSGALARTIGVTVGGNPLQAASVWLSTDAGGTNVVAGPLITNSSGVVTLLVDAGTYYVWARKDGYNPIVAQAITVS